MKQTSNRCLSFESCLVILACLLMSGCTEEPEAKKPEAQARVVRMERVVEQPRRRTFYANGQIMARRDVLLAAELSGNVAKRPLEVGAQVEAGTILIQIDPKPFALRRDLAKAAFEEVVIDAQATAGQRRVRELELAAAQDRLDRTSIRAPFAGIIESIDVTEGRFVIPGQKLLRLVNYDDLRIHCQLPAEKAAAVNSDCKISFQLPTTGSRVLEASFLHRSSRADESSNQFKLEVQVAESAGKLMVGTMARVRFEVEDKSSSAPEILISKFSVFKRYEQAMCFVVGKKRRQAHRAAYPSRSCCR